METAPIPGMNGGDDNQVFAPSDAPIINAPDTDDAINQLPGDIEQFMVENKIKKNGYKVQIKKIRPDGKAPGILPGEYDNRIPTLHDIGSWFGPGEYIYSFTYKATTEGGGKKKAQNAEYPFDLGDEWADTHKQYKLMKRIKVHRENVRIIADEKIEASLENGAEGLSGAPDGLDSLKKAASTLKDLGVTIGGSVKDGGDDLMKVLIAQQERDRETSKEERRYQNEQADKKEARFMTLLGLAIPAITGFLSNRNQQPAFDPQKQLESSMKMIGSIVDFKQDLTPEKESFGDKIFNIMEDVAPLLLNIAKEKGTAAAAASPLIQAAKNSDDFKKVVGDNVSLQYLIEKMFNSHGPENCNMMLVTLGIPLQVDATGKVTPIVAEGAAGTNTGAPADNPKTTEGEPAKDDNKEDHELEPPNPPLPGTV